MENYIGKVCPFCKMQIKESDSVKVCPTCGIPHHENCWEENKGCAAVGCSEKHDEARGANLINVCPNCGAVLDDGQLFCHKCGTHFGSMKKNFCEKCGTELQKGQKYCQKCGQKISVATDARVGAVVKRFNIGMSQKAVVPIIAGVIVVVAVVLFVLLKKPTVEEIVLSKSSVELKVDDTVSISYTINPDKASDVDVLWESSDESIAIVSDSGKLIAKGEGFCIVTATAGGKTDSLTVTVKENLDFVNLFDTYCTSDFASVGSDGSYLTIDTNPDDEDDYMDYTAYVAILNINEALGLPEYVIDDMNSTTAIMGRQSETFSDIGVTVSWSYHPDNGLEVTYKAD